MPLVYQQNINEATKLAVWHITEEEDFFLQRVLPPNAIAHPHKRLQHLAGRYLLTELFDDFPIELILIADTRKPFLADELFHFSISHCGDYAAAIVSKTNRVGVDIEIVADKIEKMKNKFLSGVEQELIASLRVPGNIQYSIFNKQMLTLAWCIKETMFKWYGAGGVDFRQYLHIDSIECIGNEFIAHCKFQKNEIIPLKIYALFFNNNFLAWLVT